MIPDPLPFERSFLSWLRDSGVSARRETIRVAAADGSCNAYRFTPSGPLRRRIVAVHGAGNDALFAWISFFKRQLASGAEILTFDLPGHGRHSDALWDAAMVPEWIDAAVRVATEGEDLPTHLVGVSLGGSVTIGSLARLSEQVASAVAVVAPLKIHFTLRGVLSEFRPRILGTLIRGWQHYGATGLLPSFGPFKREIYPLRLAERGSDEAFGYVDVLNRSLDQLIDRQAMSAVQIPVLLAYGALDQIVPAEQGQQLSRLLPRGQLFVAEEGTHLSTPLLPATEARVDHWLEAHS